MTCSVATFVALDGNALLIGSGAGLLGCLLLLMHDQVIEPRVLQGVVGTDSQLRSELKHSLEQVYTCRVDCWEDIAKVLGRIHLEGWLIFGQLRNARPGSLCRGAHDTEYPNNLVFVCGAGEQGSSGVHFCHDAASRPDIDARVVGAASQKYIGSAVP